MRKDPFTNNALTPAETSIHREDESDERRQRANRLVQLQLQQSSRLPHLAVEPATQVTAGSVELYNRLKARDPVDSIYCTTLVALQNAVIGSFAEAATSRERNEHLASAYEGMALLMEVVAVRESRRALINDADRREDVIELLVKRYLSEPSTKNG